MEILVGILAFLISRYLIFSYYQVYISDVVIYFDQAKSALMMGKQAYRDFFYPYPPLSIPLIYLPGLSEISNFASYRDAFMMEMFFLDVLLVSLMVYWSKRVLRFSPRQVMLCLFIYSGLGLLQGHLIYDRIDLAVSFFLMAMLACVTIAPQKKIYTVVLGVAGALTKMVPIFFSLVIGMVQSRVLGNKAPNRTLISQVISQVRPQVRATLQTWGMILLPIPLLLGAYHFLIAEGVFRYLGEHGQRGIQIESVWAMPFMMKKILFPASIVPIDTVYGAQHLDDKFIPFVYLLASKYLGFLLFAILAYILFKRLGENRKALFITPLFWVRTGLVIFLTFLATQRVLSPQFFIWLMPMLSLYLVIRRHAVPAVLVLLMYALTYWGFDLGYWVFVKFDPTIVAVVTARNLCLMLLTAWMLREWLVSLKAE